MTILQEAFVKQIQSHLDDATKKQPDGSHVPGLVFYAVNAQGQTLAENFSGTKGASNPEPMSADSVFWIASCTKLITSIAVLQQVEQGKIGLDDAQALYRIAPELKDKKVLKDGNKLVERSEDITLRMLMLHIAGFGYSFFNEKLRDFGRPTGWEEFSGDEKDITEQPLVNEPGSRWEYGVNIDWAGIVVERLSGLKLSDYFVKNIFEPLGIKNISMFPNQHMRENLVALNWRDVNGKVTEGDHLLRRSIFLADEPDVQKRVFNSGGAGCFAKPREYCEILSTLLNNGTSPTTNKSILKPETVDIMFTNGIPQFPNFGRQGIPPAKANYTNPLPTLYPQPGDTPQGHSVSCMITSGVEPPDRGENTGHWAGIMNAFWWCDRKNHVAGMIAGQVLPHGDLPVIGAWLQSEKAVYRALAEAK